MELHEIYNIIICMGPPYGFIGYSKYIQSLTDNNSNS